MPAQAHEVTLRARIAESLASILRERAHAAIGRDLGHAASTILRRAEAGTVAAWPADELLALARDDQGLADVVISYLGGTPAGSAIAAPSDLREAAERGGAMIAQTLHALRDGRIDNAEAHDLLPTLVGISEVIRKAISDLREQIGAPR